LKCALGHRNALLFPLENLRLGGKYQVYLRLGQESSEADFGMGDSALQMYGVRSQPICVTLKNVQRISVEFASVGSTLVTSAVTSIAGFTILGATRKARPKLCERTIASTSKCATIGTVQESFPASHGTCFIHAPNLNSRADQRQPGSRFTNTRAESPTVSASREPLPNSCG